MEILTASDRDFHLSPPALPTAATDLFLGCSFLYCSLNSSMKTKKALAGLLGLLGSLAAFPDFLDLEGFLLTASLVFLASAFDLPPFIAIPCRGTAGKWLVGFRGDSDADW
uniref:Uncharacterized protein MANES_18G003900 n=1 Tax=Rhizophora mucronata TaxID=61149 RepID=A0A2P2M6C1_RHIMU